MSIVVVETPTRPLPRKPDARSSRSMTEGLFKRLRMSTTMFETSPDTRYVPPRFLRGSATLTAKVFFGGAKENMGLKKRSGDLPHRPSTSSAQLDDPGGEQMPFPDAVRGRGTKAGDVVAVWRKHAPS